MENSGWLVESSAEGIPPKYCDGRGWTSDPEKAIWFVRREDAERFMVNSGFNAHFHLCEASRVDRAMVVRTAREFMEGTGGGN
jgi:hypothetical protein